MQLQQKYSFSKIVTKTWFLFNGDIFLKDCANSRNIYKMNTSNVLYIMQQGVLLLSGSYSLRIQGDSIAERSIKAERRRGRSSTG